jgi:putative salt-induced outer membrane protein YdiY
MSCKSGTVNFALHVMVASVILTAASPPARSAEWEPPPPMPDKFDWVQLTSGEWLKGEIKVMYEDSLEFDSEELELLSIDFEDIKELRSAQVLNVRMRGGETATGKVLLEGGSIKVLGDSPQQFPRADIMSLTAGVPRERNYWTGDVSAGGNLRSGNTDEVEASANVSFQRRTVENRVRLDYLGNYSSTNDVQSSNNHRANAVWDWFFSEKLFLRPVFFEYFKDPFQNVDRRYTLGTGIGYQLIDTPRTDWSIFAGPAYQMTRFDQVQPGESREEETGALSAGTTFEMELTSNIDLDYEYVFQLTSEEAGEYNHHMIGTIEFELTDSLDFDLSLVWDRINKPQANADGTFPEQDDYRLIVGIGYDF